MDTDPEDILVKARSGETEWKARFPEICRLIDSPSIIMLRILQAWQKRIKDKLIDFDLTATQCMMLACLMVLSRDDKVVTQADVAGFMSADKMMVSEVLRTLEKKGYVVRNVHPTDRRAKSLEVTAKGVETIEVAVKETIKMDEDFFSIIGDDRDTLIRIMRKLIDA